MAAIRQRCLGDMELQFWTKAPERYRSTAVLFEYKGTLKLGAFREAASLLARRYPALRANIIQDDECETGYSFVLPETDRIEVREFTTLSPELEEFIEYIEHRKKKAIGDRATQALFYAAVHRGENCGSIVLAIHHVLWVGVQLQTYCSELFQIYSQIVSGCDFEVEPQPFPLSADAFSEANGLSSITRAQVDGSRTLNDQQDAKIASSAKRVGNFSCFRFNKEESSALLSLKRATNVDFRSFIGSRMAVALRNHYDSDRISLSLSIDWTSRTNQSAAAVTQSASIHTVSFNVPSNADPAQVSKMLYEKVANIKAPDSNTLVEIIDGHDIVVNNFGVMPYPEIKDLELTNCYLPGASKKWPLSPELYEALVLRRFPGRPKFWLASCSFNGELTLVCALREDIDDAVLDDFISQLKSEYMTPSG